MGWVKLFSVLQDAEEHLSQNACYDLESVINQQLQRRPWVQSPGYDECIVLGIH